ncbi:hypothetical protein F2P45_23395 [Massilia sp. CCM 8733]|uniref:Uncharacterized protein n=1 Tax=Massilia mucilaginosa TaxID=2609282 RepID=A0ABX0NYG0_9BURK|nr:hypothetical protein [Massilia mucilaginosa]NHZ91927.1 hypothetical protein [Massilia mucilaginosa]
MKTLRQQSVVLAEWANELALRFGRPVDELIKGGLMASDFSADVEVRTPYGMTVRFVLAFFLVRPDRGQAVVFSEHSGYAEFDMVDGMVFAEISESRYYHDAENENRPIR